ncbi:MAG: radical SAM protein [candidate division Zixibacteria bacterium]|nr:radical SAM protein [candidate division Zixibacteria bacterium]
MDRKTKIHVPYLEFNLTEHCNLRCRYCGQFAPFNRVYYADFDTFCKDLTALSRVYYTNRFRFTGGEPLLHKDIVKFARAVKECRIAGEIFVCTNGKLVDKMPDELFDLIDVLDISWYPASGDKSKIESAKEKCQRYDTKLHIMKVRKFQVNNVSKPITDEQLVREIYQSCRIAHAYHCHTFYNGRYYKCAKPLFMKSYFSKIDLAIPDLEIEDGIPIHKPNLRDRLVMYMHSEEPLKSCFYCLGTSGNYLDWRELTHDEKESPPIISQDLRELINEKHMSRTLTKIRLLRSLLGPDWILYFRRLYHRILPRKDYRKHEIDV